MPPTTSRQRWLWLVPLRRPLGDLLLTQQPEQLATGPEPSPRTHHTVPLIRTPPTTLPEQPLLGGAPRATEVAETMGDRPTGEQEVSHMLETPRLCPWATEVRPLQQLI